MRKIAANKIHTVSNECIDNGLVVVDREGKVLKVDVSSNYSNEGVEYFEGEIIPGLINTHCHLELSHMKGKVNTGTGLIPFIKSVVQNRAAEEEEIMQAIAAADEEMYQNGIVAVGDISNVADTFKQKQKSRLIYYTFLEFFDFLQDNNAASEFQRYKAVYDQLETNKRILKSCVPHAPYSVSKSLFRLINEVNKEIATISIHNQETPPEIDLFQKGNGGFVDFYEEFGIPMNNFKMSGYSSIQYALENMDSKHRTLFVHNTLTTDTDIKIAHDWSDKVFWATCPNANLYIENRLPDYALFINNDATITIGTDSLTSNWKLCILEEMKTIAKYQSYVSKVQLIEWATLNGAKALGLDQELGSIEVGKKCGLNLLTNLKPDDSIGDDTRIKRLI